MSNFDGNQWYHVYVGGSKDNSFVGTYLVFGDPHLEDTTKHNTTVGAVFKSTNQIESKAEPTQFWQIIPVGDEYYVLRTQAGGVNGYLSTFYAEGRTNLTSRTLARMTRDNVSDASVYWKINSWRDGTFQLTNKKNGTDWLLEIGGEHDDEDGTEARMGSNFTVESRRQFSFDAIGEVNGTDIGKIDNQDWASSLISLPATTTQSSTASATVTVSASTTTSTSNTSNTSSSPTTSASSGGLSTGAKAGIGAGIGAAALIALVVLGLFLFRRRKRRAAAPAELPNPYTTGYSDEGGQSATTKYGHAGVNEKAELDTNGQQRAELPMFQPPPAELSGGDVPRQELAGGDAHTGGQLDGVRV
ncbi:hypothetical protein DPSP01_011372 [Paraphaeosphaeria sporulosa]|uniref:Uncharacterized protein n=1 Tax=Paraphaeosphaeria sporulosa TaxID=1460663 RepID=A0A177BWS3_9PLEO|nr:uncharacterized protein CC84DRAFT_1222904 [Paraphaeosphaeria sporulosa]OAF99201.1 hypothetical protein CC84DRAFT_1222904 [Paraphaeosphaeria sporulosa]